MIAPRITAMLAGVSIAFAAGWAVNGWRKDGQIAQIERDHAAAAEAASETARLKERAWNKQLEEARNEAAKRETAIRADAAAARNAADGLRDDLAAIRRKLPELAADAVRQYTDTLADVFGACADEYRSMAESADGHASDTRTLMDAWPR